MKTRSIVFVVCLMLLLVVRPLVGQTYEKLKLHHGCNYAGAQKEAEYFIYYPSEKALAIMEEILKASSLPIQKFQLRSSNVTNAVATEENGVRYILYSQEFMAKVERNSKNKWAVYSILAHEIGHHLLNHDFAEEDPEKRKEMELEADEYSGRILNTLCALESDALAAINSLDISTVTHNYPVLSARAEVIANGWFQQGEDWKSQGKNPCGELMDLKFGDAYKRNNQAKNVQALVKAEQMIITYKAAPERAALLCESFIVTPGNSGLAPSSIEWKTDRKRFGESREVIWHFAKDGYTREQVLKPAELGVAVFDPGKVPRRVSFGEYSIGLGMIVAGGITTGVGYGLKSDALKMHEPYEEVRDPVAFSNAFGQSRQDVYNEANSKYHTSQIVRGIGWTVVGGGVILLIDKLLKHKKSKIGTLYVGDEGIGVRTSFY